MKISHTIIAGMATGIMSVTGFASQCAGIQCVAVTNLLKNSATAQAAIKIEVYDSGRKCYTFDRLPYGKKITLTVLKNDPDCKTISSLVITPLNAGHNMASLTLNIHGNDAFTINEKMMTSLNK